MALPAPSELTTYLGTGAKAAKFQFADSTNSPSAATREVWISHCPGVYDSSVLNPPGSATRPTQPRAARRSP